MIRDWLGAHEKATVIILTILFLLANIIAYSFIFGAGSQYQHITVDYKNTDQGLQVTEHFTAQITPSDQFRVLYRSFNDQICTDASCAIRIVSVQCRSSPYVSLSGTVLDGNLQPLHITDPDLAYRIHRNEVGCYSAGFAGKTEDYTITYLVSQSLVEQNNYQHSFFSNDHFRITSIDAHGTQGSSSASLIAANVPIAIDTRTGKISASGAGIPLIMLFFILVPFFIYFVFGRDPKDIVPEYLSTVPNTKREPWEVDVFMSGAKISSNGLGSLILGLYMKGIAQVEVTKSFLFEELTITVYKNPKGTPTAKEQALLNILKQNKVKDTAQATIYTFHPRERVSDMQSLLSDGTKEIADATYNKTGSRFLIAIAIIALIAGWLFPTPYNIILIVNGLLLLFSAFIIPAAVFSKFKDNHHKEYLQWIAFKRMLMDYAQIQRYLKEDYRQWKLWIGYATALGAAEHLLKAMKELKIINAAQYDQYHSTHTNAIFIVNHATSRGGGGGGFGGGGFGGGGGGGR